MTRFVFVFMSLTISGLFFTAAYAEGDVFTVPRVEVDATGPSAAEARETALAVGRQTALQMLFKRLSPSDYWRRLPKITGQDAVNLVAGIQVVNERTSSTRYLAEVSYSFKPEKIRQALRAQGIAFSETQARTAIIVPVFETLDGTFLWEANNPWTLAWQTQNFTNELVPLLAPLGQIEDIASVALDDVKGVNWERLGPFAERYGVSEVLVAYARWQKTSLTEDLFVRFTRLQGSEIGGASADAPVDVAIRNTGQHPLEDLMDFAIGQGMQRLQSRWKAQTIIRSDAVEDLLQATIHFENHGDWLAIRQKLNDLAVVKNMEISSLSMGGADVFMRYVGSLSQLQVTMAQLDLNLDMMGPVTTITLGTSERAEATLGDENNTTNPWDQPPTIASRQSIDVTPKSAQMPDGSMGGVSFIEMGVSGAMDAVSEAQEPLSEGIEEEESMLAPEEVELEEPSPEMVAPMEEANQEIEVPIE